MNRRELVLTALAPSGGAQLSPVQVQKLIFLIDFNVGSLLDGPHFNFRPYHYGPFDSSIYREIESLVTQGLAEIVPGPKWKRYRLTPEGLREGGELLENLPQDVRKYVVRAVEFVRALSFTELVSAIYKAHPEMRENSVFQE